MSRKPGPRKISITRMAMNGASAVAFDLVIKLAYHFSDSDRPQLEIFADSEEASANEWHIYGAPADIADDRVARPRFSAPGDTADVRLGERQVRIRYLGRGEREIDYPNGGKTVEPVYEFMIEPGGGIHAGARRARD